MRNFLTLAIFLMMTNAASAETTIDKYESNLYGFALNCNGQTVSSVRHNWKTSLEIEILAGSSLYAAKESIAQKGSGLQGIDFEAPVKLIQDGVDWRDQLQVVNEHLGLPSQIDGCAVEVVWVDFGRVNNGASKIIGRKEFWNKLDFADLYLLFLPAAFRNSTSELALRMIDLTEAHSRQWWAHYFEIAKNRHGYIKLDKGYASRCKVVENSRSFSPTFSCATFVNDATFKNPILTDRYVKELTGEIHFDEQGRIDYIKNLAIACFSGKTMLRKYLYLDNDQYTEIRCNKPYNLNVYASSGGYYIEPANVSKEEEPSEVDADEDQIKNIPIPIKKPKRN